MIIDPVLVVVLVLLAAALGAAAVGILVCVCALARRVDQIEREIGEQTDGSIDSRT